MSAWSRSCLYFEDTQVEYALLRSCAGACQLMYRLRGTPLGVHSLAVMKEADEILHNALESLLKTSVPPAAWQQDGLRTSEGGFGLRHLSDVCDSAFLGAVLSSSALVAKLVGKSAVRIPGVQQAVGSYAARLDVEAQESFHTLAERLRGEVFEATEDDRNACPTRPQAYFQQKVDSTLWRQLLQDEKRRRHLDRLEAVRRPYAGAVWACFPTEALGLKMSPGEFVTAAKVWLGLEHGTKALLEQGADQVGRHDALRDVLFEAARVAGARPYRERTVDTSAHRPGDVYLPGWSHGCPLAVDITVSHPSQAYVNPRARDEDSSASIRAGEAAARAKVRKHQARCNAQGVDFQALAVCSFGGWLPEGMEVCQQLGCSGC